VFSAGVDIYQREENDTSSISWIVRGVATVTVGLSSYFDCVAETGSVTTTLQWSAMNGFAAGVSVSSLSNGQRLEFPRVQDSHVGVYTCRDVEHGEDITLTITTGKYYLWMIKFDIKVQSSIECFLRNYFSVWQLEVLVLNTSSNPNGFSIKTFK